MSNSRAFMPANPVLLQFSWKSKMRVADYELETSEYQWIQKTGLNNNYSTLLYQFLS